VKAQTLKQADDNVNKEKSSIKQRVAARQAKSANK